MFDVKATHAWWNFFHRYSQIYQGDNFDAVVLLGIKLLQCETCQKDAAPFYKTIGKHKTAFDKIHILHNYVNRKLKKKIYTIEESRRHTSDIFLGQVIQWEVFLTYYFNLLFLISKYINPSQLDDLREFSALVYQSLNMPKRIAQNAIEVNTRNKASREQIQMQTFDYYNKTLSALRNVNVPFQNYKMIFGKEPKKQRVCGACAKRHKLYMEQHQLKDRQQPKSKPRLQVEKRLIGPPKPVIPSTQLVQKQQSRKNNKNIVPISQFRTKTSEQPKPIPKVNKPPALVPLPGRPQHVFKGRTPAPKPVETKTKSKASPKAVAPKLKVIPKKDLGYDLPIAPKKAPRNKVILPKNRPKPGGGGNSVIKQNLLKKIPKKPSQSNSRAAIMARRPSTIRRLRK